MDTSKLTEDQKDRLMQLSHVGQHYAVLTDACAVGYLPVIDPALVDTVEERAAKLLLRACLRADGFRVLPTKVKGEE